jgi:NADH:ubiquinone oxidoreductase subunit 3 (subunit A)
MAATAASEKSRMLNAGRTNPGSSKRIIRNAGAAINTLNNARMPNDFSEGTFLFIHLALEAIILFPWHKGILTERAPLI